MKINYILFFLFSGVNVFGGLTTLFLRQKGIEFFVIMLMSSVYNITTILIDFPTGVLTDVIGKKKVLITGSIFKVLYFVCLICSDNVLVMFLAHIILAVVNSLLSVTKTAFIYDLDGDKDNFTSRYGNVLAIVRLFAIGINIVCGYLYDINKSYPYMLMVIIAFMSVMFAFSLKEPEKVNKEGRNWTKYKETFTSSLKEVKRSREVKSILLFSIMSTSFLTVLASLKQPYMTYIGLSGKEIGVIGSILQLGFVLAGKFSDTFINLTRGATFTIVMLLITLTSMLLGEVNVRSGVWIYALTPFITAFKDVSYNKYINNHIESSIRTSILSVNTTICAISRALTLPLSGFILETKGIPTMYFTISVCSVISTMLLVRHMNVRLSPKKEGGML